MELQSVITCPECGHSATETMPTDACQYIYDCKGCGHRMKPIKGKCCGYCSYGSVPCPPIQSGDGLLPVRLLRIGTTKEVDAPARPSSTASSYELRA
jgi:hypothetical protein